MDGGLKGHRHRQRDRLTGRGKGGSAAWRWTHHGVLLTDDRPCHPRHGWRLIVGCLRGGCLGCAEAEEPAAARVPAQELHHVVRGHGQHHIAPVTRLSRLRTAPGPKREGAVG